MISDAAGYTEEGVAQGMLRPTDDAHGRAAVLTIWSLGALVLHEHLERALGVDLLADHLDATPYFRAALEIMGRGVLTEEFHERVVDVLAHEQEVGT